jgi:hypothetical protein
MEENNDIKVVNYDFVGLYPERMNINNIKPVNFKSILIKLKIKKLFDL